MNKHYLHTAIKGKTVRQSLDHYGGFAPGFDGLRLILSFIVVFWHAALICGIDNVDVPAAGQMLLRTILPMFFFLGGFLVTGSAERLKNVKKFLTFRVLRIVPALMVEVTLSAIILGAFATTLPLSEYFTHSGFYTYFLNILGFVHFYLPGVFENNPREYVNINLWMLPYELYTYMIMSVLIMTGVIFNKKVFLGVFSIATVFLLVLMAFRWNFGWGSVLFVHPWMFVYAFFLGVLTYLYADKIKISLSWGLLSIAGLIFLMLPYTTFIGILCVSYLTLCLGFVDMRRMPLIKRGDYSYGVYLYGCPIEQALWLFVPALRQWELLFAVALPTTLLFAMMSWHLIEKPFLGLKNKIGLPRKKKLPDGPGLP